MLCCRADTDRDGTSEPGAAMRETTSDTPSVAWADPLVATHCWREAWTRTFELATVRDLRCSLRTKSESS